MSVELKAGLWGVSRDKGRVGIITENGKHPYQFNMGHLSLTHDGLWYAGGVSNLDVTHTFPTEKAAKAFAAGKPVKKPINYQRLALRMSKAPTIREARGMYERAVGRRSSCPGTLVGAHSGSDCSATDFPSRTGRFTHPFSANGMGIGRL